MIDELVANDKQPPAERRSVRMSEPMTDPTQTRVGSQ